MADNSGVWGIDIGQAGLKAIRLRYAEAAKQVIAVAFDYVPHPKILSQPDAVPEELIPQALQTFLSRNQTQGDKIVISVPGQTSLAKFIKLPPVESSKVAEIVKYEAKQQIPFDLDDVIWDFQPLGGGIEESGFLLDAEVGLFAMKRDQVFHHLKPYTDAKQEVEIIQTAPLALYNFVSFDFLKLRPADDDEEEQTIAPEEHVIVLDMGADNTTLLVTNGNAIWIRNVPLGGNHFTRALTKEMKLTFAKAEHLKCNATRSPDPKAVFQALRPVFNDYVSEIQRSIGYFASVNREARITKVLGVGNGFKLAGLQKFLQQNLQYEVERVEQFSGVVGDSVLNAPLFQDNIMSFTVPYGLALQGLKRSRIRTSLLPREIATARTIRRKKPWAVAAAALLMTSLSVSAAGYGRVWKSVSETRFGAAEAEVKKLEGEVSSNKSAYDAEVGRHGKIIADGKVLTGGLARRELWLEIYKAINESLPRDLGDQLDVSDPTLRNRVKIVSVTQEKEADLKTWFDALKERPKDAMLAADKETPPSGEGYVFTLHGVHYRNDPNNPDMAGQLFVENTVLKNLQQWQMNGHPVRQVGISHAVITTSQGVNFQYDPNKLKGTRDPLAQRRGFGFGGGIPGFGGGGGAMDSGEEYGGAMPGGNPYGGGGNPYAPSGGVGVGAPNLSAIEAEKAKERIRPITQTQFTLQFAWKPTLPADRPETDPTAPAVGDPLGGDSDATPDAATETPAS